MARKQSSNNLISSLQTCRKSWILTTYIQKYHIIPIYIISIFSLTEPDVISYFIDLLLYKINNLTFSIQSTCNLLFSSYTSPYKSSTPPVLAHTLFPVPKFHEITSHNNNPTPHDNNHMYQRSFSLFTWRKLSLTKNTKTKNLTCSSCSI